MGNFLGSDIEECGREVASRSNLGRLLAKKRFGSFREMQRWSAQHPEEYFPEVWEHQSLMFHERPRCVLDKSTGLWLPGARLNAAECCLVSKPDSFIAVVYRNEGEDELPLQRLTLAQFRANVRYGYGYGYDHGYFFFSLLEVMEMTWAWYTAALRMRWKRSGFGAGTP